MSDRNAKAKADPKNKQDKNERVGQKRVRSDTPELAKDLKEVCMLFENGKKMSNEDFVRLKS